jgi:hypothetical protein
MPMITLGAVQAEDVPLSVDLVEVATLLLCYEVVAREDVVGAAAIRKDPGSCTCYFFLGIDSNFARASRR